jgi:hypothetical protein
MKIRTILAAAFAAGTLSIVAVQGHAGVTSSQYNDQLDFSTTGPNGTPIIQTSTTTATTGAQTESTVGFFQLLDSGAQTDTDDNNNPISTDHDWIVGQTVNPQTTFTLSEIDFYVSGGQETNLSVHIFAPVQAGGTGTLPSGGTNDGFVTPGPSAVDLLNPSNDPATEQKFTMFGNAGKYYQQINLTGAQQVTLTAGTKYDIEIWSDGGPVSTDSNAFFLDTTQTSGLYKFGNGYQNRASETFDSVTGDPNGSTSPAGYGAALGNFRGNDGNSGRDLLMALYGTATPEPTSLGLIGLAAIGALRRRRA